MLKQSEQKQRREKVLLGKQKERDGTFRQVNAKGCARDLLRAGNQYKAGVLCKNCLRHACQQESCLKAESGQVFRWDLLDRGAFEWARPRLIYNQSAQWCDRCCIWIGRNGENLCNIFVISKLKM